jgi:hypothetical protein
MSWPTPEVCTCCRREAPCPLSIGTVISLCADCRPEDLNAYHEAVIVGPWPPPVTAAAWVCPHPLGNLSDLSG